MKNMKFRAWDSKRKEWYGESSDEMLTFYDFHIFGECTLLCPPLGSDLPNLIVTQFTGLQDSKGKDIYEGDIVYLAGLGDIEITFPFIDLYEAKMENDVGEIKGNIYQNPELMGK